MRTLERRHRTKCRTHRTQDKRLTTNKIRCFASFILSAFVFVSLAHAQDVTNPAQKSVDNAGTPQKSNARPLIKSTPEPFDGASVEKMASECVTLETEAGAIKLEMLAETAPETARRFLNLAATGAFNTTTFSRVVKDFVIQGGDLSTGEKWTAELARKAARTIPDEPNPVKHVRGIVSMARSDAPNSATTFFFILVGDASHLDGKFSAFGRVTSGMDIADAINHAPLNGEKPTKPVRITRAIVEPCKQ